MNSGFDRSREPGVELFDWIGVDIDPAQSAPDVFVAEPGVIEWRFFHAQRNDMRREKVVDLSWGSGSDCA